METRLILLPIFTLSYLSYGISAPAMEGSGEFGSGFLPSKLTPIVTELEEHKNVFGYERCWYLSQTAQTLGRFTPKGGRWTKNSLAYHINTYTLDLPESQTREAIRRAFQLWADASVLSFSEASTSSAADIVIDFVVGEHYHEPPVEQEHFDGPGKDLAHAAYPPAGFIHFDDDETFSLESEDGVNLLVIAAHEIGHALGLGHSTNPQALMFCGYSGHVKDIKLHQDDIDGIQYLYGKPEVDIAHTSKSTGKQDILPSCPLDATTYYAPDDVTFAFKGQRVWAFNDQGVIAGYPKKINQVFSGAPSSSIRAVVSAGSRTYMFKGNQVWLFFGKVLERGFPRTLRRSFPRGINAALVHDERIYLLKGSRIYEFMENELSVGWSERINDHWRDLPTRIDAALQWRNGTNYFMKGHQYWMYDEDRGVMAKKYQRHGSISDQDAPLNILSCLYSS